MTFFFIAISGDLGILVKSFGMLANVLVICAANPDQEIGIMFMILSALPLYSYTTFAAMIDNSHSESPKFAIDDDLTTAASSVAHCRAGDVQYPIVATIGWIVGRGILGDAVHVRLLGRLFLLGIMLLR